MEIIGLDVRRAWFDFLRPSGVNGHGVLRMLLTGLTARSRDMAGETE